LHRRREKGFTPNSNTETHTQCVCVGGSYIYKFIYRYQNNSNIDVYISFVRLLVQVQYVEYNNSVGSSRTYRSVY